MQYPQRWAAPARPPVNQDQEHTSAGREFWAEAKARHTELFTAHASVASDFASVEEFVEVLRKQAWALTEELCKSSYRNGQQRRYTPRARRRSAD